MTANQNNFIKSLQASLLPESTLIDGRTERDWLYFISSFASLINFFNENNQQDGNWSPFILKDPVFLVAAISKTKYRHLLDSHRYACLQLQQLDNSNDNLVDLIDTSPLDGFFEHLMDAYFMVADWTFYMQKSREIYKLKQFVFREVIDKISVEFWAVRAFLSDNGIGDSKVAPMRNINRDAFDQVIWKTNKGKDPYWKILNIEQTHGSSDIINVCLQVLTNAGDTLFVFLKEVIRQAEDEFDQLTQKKSRHADTTLLRSFIAVLSLHQQQMNGIAQKHLDFYYKNILKETEKPAKPSSAFLTASTSKNDAAVMLPAGTLFEAGTDSNKKPIYFTTLDNESINPATIASVTTLNALKDYPLIGNTSFAITPVTAPTKINKDSKGNILSWPTLGSASSTIPLIQQGLAMASPLLLLKEGDRTIFTSLTFDVDVTLSVFETAQYSLSTANAWLTIDPKDVKVGPGLDSKTVIVEILVSVTQPAIEPFLSNPDGFDAKWAMLRVLFESVANPGLPPNLQQLEITVQANGLSTFQLYNDYGKLSVKKPFALFGPMPAVGSGFIIGSDEVFSKPLNNLDIILNWDNLQRDFIDYYQEYNDYLHKAPPPKLFGGLLKFFKSSEPILYDSPFNNTTFTVDFELLQQKKWNSWSLSKMSLGETSSGLPLVPYHTDAECTPELVDFDMLFDTVKNQMTNSCVTTDFSRFSYQKPSTDSLIVQVPDPNIQLSPLQYNDAAVSGFMKMSLTGPQYGFGYEIYQNVITYIGLINASALMSHPPKPFVSSASLPYVPKLKSFTANYIASYRYDLTASDQKYELQCYAYSPFSNYKVYDSSALSQTGLQSLMAGLPVVSNNVPLYPVFDFTSGMFIELAQLVPGNDLSLYFELQRTVSDGGTLGDMKYFCLTASGWTSMSVVSDSTNNLSCSGIIKVAIPETAASQTPFMPGSNSWISIVATGDPACCSETIALNTNGFKVKRIGAASSPNAEIAPIPAATMTKPVVAFPSLKGFSQLFPSFGGKPAESATDVYQRVSSSIKTKNRAMSPSDYYSLVCRNFNDIYHVKTFYDSKANTTNLFLVKSVSVATEANAFMPQATICLENKVRKFIKKRSSPFANITVSNFNPEYVVVSAGIQAETGYNPQTVIDNVNLALNIYLSPWIVDAAPQVVIDQSIDIAAVASFISGIEGVSMVADVVLSSYVVMSHGGKSFTAKKENSITPSASTVFVSCMANDIYILHN